MKTTAFYISGEALEQLEKLAEEYDTAEINVLEYLIRVRARVSDQHENARRRREACNKWVKDHSFDNFSLSTAYTAGYNQGWQEFQTRHDLPEDRKFLVKVEKAKE